MSVDSRPVVCFFTTSAGDWGGASRVLFTNLRLMDPEKLTSLLLLPGAGPIEPQLKERGVRYLVWGPLTEPGNPISYFCSFVRAWRLFRRERVALVHVNSSNFWRPAELLAARGLGIPVIAHYHVINRKPAPAMSWCEAAIAVSQYTADQSGPAGLAKTVIYNPVDIERFDAGRSLRPELGIADGTIVVGFLGQIRDIKGVADFIAVAHRITNPNVRFLIAGECRDPRKFPGSYTEQDLRELIRDDVRIRYIGYVAEVENVYHTADIVVVPSRWQDPFPLVNLEAGACGKPVVATRVGGIPEAIEDGVNGYLLEPLDVAGIADRVDMLIADAELRARMGRSGRELVERKYTSLPVREFEALLLRYATR